MFFPFKNYTTSTYTATLTSSAFSTNLFTVSKKSMVVIEPLDNNYLNPSNLTAVAQIGTLGVGGTLSPQYIFTYRVEAVGGGEGGGGTILKTPPTYGTAIYNSGDILVLTKGAGITWTANLRFHIFELP